MTEEILTSAATEVETSVSDERRVYELGYLMVSTLSEQDREALLVTLRSLVESHAGTIISEAAPQEQALAYPMYTRDREKNVSHEMAFFGWVKFEVTPAAAVTISETARVNKSFIRTLFFETVKEDTRVAIIPGGLKDVKRTGTIAPAHRGDEEKKDVSEAELDKTVDSIVADLV
jgi:ribosomal protein S6